MSAIPDESSLFNGFSGTECKSEPICSVIMDSYKTVDVNFILKTYTISTIAGEGGKILPENPVVKYGGTQKFDIIPDSGYSVQDVMVDNVSIGAVNSYIFTNVTSSHSISVTFIKDKVYYTIASSASEGGTINPSGDILVEEGGSITFTISSNTGYYLDYVLVDDSDIGKVSEYTFSNITQNHTIYAKFEPHLDDAGIDVKSDADYGDVSGSKDNGSSITIVNDKSDAGCSCNILE